MHPFPDYFRLGLEHITDPGGYDHMLFLAALCARYGAAQWRALAVLVTAFTLGHSLTLALAALDVFRAPTAWVEFLIPVTIALTAAYNLRAPQAAGLRAQPVRYAAAAGFGLIHGLGFSNFLRSIAGSGASIVEPLLAFNLGLEAGQLLIVAALMGVLWAAVRFGRIPAATAGTALSAAAGLWALVMAWQRAPV